VGLRKRVAYANVIQKKYPKHKVIFVSIHFDVLPASIEGVRVIESNGGNALGKFLSETFLECNRANGKWCLVESGDKTHGLKNIFVLGKNNLIKEKVLIELGNFKNTKDIWRIRDFHVRENYAQLKTRALIKMMKGEKKK